MRIREQRPLSKALFLLIVPLALALAVLVAPSQAASPTLTNGCTVSTRGIPSCGAYVGAAYGSNANVKSWETTMGKHLGVHRTYWSSGQVTSAVNQAKDDVANHRVGWLSFIPPHSWADMVAGKGDAWAKDLATKMSTIGGPVWVAVGHEPENNGGDIQQWKAMQARLAPIMRAAAPNLGYSIILMGYHEFYGNTAKYGMNVIWPNTKIDIAGFDIYEEYGVKKAGQATTTKWKNFSAYFSQIKAWSQKTGVPWGLAETAYSNPAAAAKPSWPTTTYDNMVSYGGVAFSYFDTTLHSQADWTLSTAAKKNAFTSVNKSAATMK